MDMNLGQNAGGRGDAGWRGNKGEKKLYNCNTIINKIHLKNKENYKIPIYFRVKYYLTFISLIVNQEIYIM